MTKLGFLVFMATFVLTPMAFSQNSLTNIPARNWNNGYVPDFELIFRLTVSEPGGSEVDKITHSIYSIPHDERDFLVLVGSKLASDKFANFFAPKALEPMSIDEASAYEADMEAELGGIFDMGVSAFANDPLGYIIGASKSAGAAMAPLESSDLLSTFGEGLLYASEVASESLFEFGLFLSPSEIGPEGELPEIPSFIPSGMPGYDFEPPSIFTTVPEDFPPPTIYIPNPPATIS